jgi:hypothetical protein
LHIWRVASPLDLQELSRYTNGMNFLETCKFDWVEILNFSERPFRAKLIPSKIWKDLDKYRNDSVGLQNYSKKWRTSIKFMKNRSKAKVWNEFIAVGGEYWERRCEIQIHTDKFDTFKFSEDSWERFKFKYIQVLMHELIHFMQYDRRYEEPSKRFYKWKKTYRKKTDEMREYYSCYDEVQAYAHCIYLDYKRSRPNKNIYDLLLECRDRSNSPTLTDIFKTFDYDFRNNETLKILLKEVYRWHRKYEKVLS